MTDVLRPRQVTAIDGITTAFLRGFKAPILRASTGFGKTHTSATIIRRALAKGKRVWFLAHLDSILNATARKLEAEGIQYGWIAANHPGDRRHAVQIASVLTLVRRLDRYDPPELIIVDEAHLAVADSYQEVFKWAKAGPKFWEKGGAYLLHLTATPQRLDGRGMGEVADTIIDTCSTQELIDEGLLVPVRYFEPTAIGKDGKPALVGDPLSHYQKHAHGRPGIGFCVSNIEAQRYADMFRDAGYRTLAINGDSDPAMRDAAERGIQSGDIDLVFNCKLWVAGVDVPAVSCIIDMRPTDSLVTYLQGLGRGLRTDKGKTDLIYLDCVGNKGRHGDPTAERVWTLASAAQGSGKLKSEVPVKCCPKCFATVASIASTCMCGHVFEVKLRKIERIDGELVEAAEAAIQAKRMERQAQGRAQTLEELVAIGQSRGMKRPRLWANFVLRARHAKEMRA
jgi:superfamily II DNA or RNA helicase